MDFILEKQRNTNVIMNCDVLVAGGGIAGVSAALAAARNGADVILVEKECLLGGLATLGLVTIYLPLCDGLGKQVSYGISEELLKLSIKHGAEDRYPKAWLENGSLEQRKEKRYEVQFNPHLFALELERLLIKEGVHILYDSMICDTKIDENKISHVMIENKSGRNAVKVKSVIDATGDADICKLSNVKTELYAPKNILANWYYYMSNGTLHLKMLGFAEIPEEDKKDSDEKPLVSTRYTGIDGAEISEMLLQGHEQMRKDILKHRQNDKSYLPVTTPTIPQLRMTRRVVGEYKLDEKEVHKHFEDSVGLISDWRKRGPVFEIPFGTLFNKEVKNLLVAGRCISVTDSMWDVTRVIPACAVTGEAAGTAAALTDDFSRLDIGVLQKSLLQKGARLHEKDNFDFCSEKGTI